MLVDLLPVIAAACAAALGSLLLWKFYGIPVLTRFIHKHGVRSLMEGFEKAAKDPKSPERKILHNAIAGGMDAVDAMLCQMLTFQEVTDEQGNKIKVYPALTPGIKALLRTAEAHFVKAFAANLQSVMGKIGGGGEGGPMDAVGGLMGMLGGDGGMKGDIGSMIGMLSKLGGTGGTQGNSPPSGSSGPTTMHKY